MRAFFLLTVLLLTACNRLPADRKKQTREARAFPLHKASCWSYNDAKIKSILAGKDGPQQLLTQDNNGYLPLHIAVYNGYTTVAQALLENDEYREKQLLAYDNNRNLPLHIALSSNYDNHSFNRLKIVQVLLEENKYREKQFSTPDKNGNLPLHIAVMGGYLESDYFYCIDELLKGEGAKYIEHKNGKNETPLQLAKRVKKSRREKEEIGNMTSVIKLLKKKQKEMKQQKKN